MPQINRIRVNNVKYNFGTQFYDDFVMRFNCRNTIYDLANGGGKSLLMLLLLQNMIPNCTLDDKQPIEKLFRQGGGNTCIHSLVEWKLDSCYQKDGFKYMTTGFCARKGRQSEDDEEISTAAAGSGAGVEYFNYCIFYREFGDNDIKNLPLSSNGERITYNGLKAYLRDLEKKDFNVRVQIFDRKGDYQTFISRYGIFESAWEIVRGINKTEGHVRTYFESNYKTSRKVVEDLFIEEIIQKSYNNRLSVDNDEGRMAKTLLDIKDKLIELSRKHNQISSYDSQIAAIDNFKEYVDSFKEFYERKENLQKQLYNLLIAAKAACKDKEEETAKLEQLKNKMAGELLKEKEAIAVAEIMLEKKSLAGMEALVQETEKKKEQKGKGIEELRKKIALLESANDYDDYISYEKSFKEITVALDNRLRQEDDITGELKALAKLYKNIFDRDLRLAEEKKAIADNNVVRSRVSMDDAKSEMEQAQTQWALLSGFKEHIEESIKTLEKELSVLTSEYGILVADNARKDMVSVKAEIDELKEELHKAHIEKDETIRSISRCNEKINAAQICINMLDNQAEKLKENNISSRDNEKKLEQIVSVYGAEPANGLDRVILDAYRHMEKDYNEIYSEVSSLESFISNAKEGTYVCRDKERDKFKEYLVLAYGDDVVEGHEWFRELNPGQKRDVLKRAPFVEYGFIIKNDFERVKADETIGNYGRGANIYPVISEQVLYDTKLEVNKDLIVFGLKDMNFLRDDTRLETEIKMAEEELETAKASLEKWDDRMKLVWSDYTFVLQYIAIYKSADLSSTIQEIENRIQEENQIVLDCREELKSLNDIRNNQDYEIGNLETKVSHAEKQFDGLSQASRINDKLTQDYKDLKESDIKRQKAQMLKDELEDKYNSLSREYTEAVNYAQSIEDGINKLKSLWENDYAPYYDESVEVNDELIKYADDSEGISRRFFGLKSALAGRNSDVADKEALLNHLKSSMTKCKESIEYRDCDFEAVKAMFEKGELSKTEGRIFREIKAELAEILKAYESDDEELESQEALYNRLEGSIAHGINQIEEKYGEYREFDCDNPESFIEQHKVLIKKLEENIKTQDSKKKSLADSLRDLMLWERDLERIVRDAGMEVMDEISDDTVISKEVKLSDYEAVSKEYSSLIKLEYKKTEEFTKNKQKLIDLLTGFDASDLASEIKISMSFPENVEKTEVLINSLTETNTFIKLEKSRIHKGIEDMERIKDNFENRCVQICCNIKTELDRLPKISNITLDNEQISIIGLQIPYIKEELYKERMASYIDETIVIAESFKDAQERLKYIRNRLTWKRLFSVIVTDMNSIRINLYKRERIKDQSRYLRYEEAVGSTGQSQGIYIQFLIAVINYISNMNTVNPDGGTVGKTIFIDNPFGAAKDIYIWEPIFKLLATNHVQLIVPARGATPAITGRFDVNYILGQKLADNRQQTVVVDYYSNTKESELEYTRMDYEQAVFDFSNM
ncbi:MAG: hypothetical protein Q4F06_02080 [Eubacteriales bacterium]|nr:hypothetical protein [Eubacteriales bacterium]